MWASILDHWRMWAAIAASTLGVIVAAPSAWSVLDPYVPATRGYVVAQQTDLRRKLQDHSDTLYQIRRGQLDREIFDMERRDSKVPEDQYRLRQLKDDLRRLDAAAPK